MCMGTPMKIVSVSADGAWAECVSRDGSVTETLDLRLVGEQPAGGWVLGFLGAAHSVLTAEEAAQVADALEAVTLVQQGHPVDHLFADLVDREPELPDFLKDRQS
ncbi:Hydrogenase maturation protein HupF/HypC/HoxL [Caenispirillum salinarum AK4]|uniref:Hydrogenase maturation protein HupF/HypC/HoxL n=1 Tax=Caenispirillum salinarum AK4 TaxID=1238182 RepID=K9GZN4_9PROT|nr:HypC/HybG/HupF family hydrogenase formation chaperone [Caenispirillum salinarum]EKV30752.1 Hydrogenase maturation protein HupF/HypC/HoxL [Caenispirillum salinarum AK4]